jgi:DNA-binding response OmpR family regulator
MASSPEPTSDECVVLVVDDAVALVDILRACLRDEGLRVIEASDGQTALAAVREAEPALVLLDLNLPRLSGVEVFQAIRAEFDVPIIMVTSRANEHDRIVGLELGATEYVAKPFSRREVVGRVKAVLRRWAFSVADTPMHQRDMLHVGPIEIDRRAHEVRRNGSLVQLTPTEFRVLNALASNRGCALTREQIRDLICADDGIVDRTLDRHIVNLRHKIEDQPSRPKIVLTVFGVGYKITDPARFSSH